MIIPLAAGLVEQVLKIDIRWLYIPVGIVALLLVIEIVHVIVRHNKNKGTINSLDAIDNALELDGHRLDELTQANEYIFEIENGKLMPPYSESAPKIFGESEVSALVVDASGADNAVEPNGTNDRVDTNGTDNAVADIDASSMLSVNGANDMVESNDTDNAVADIDANDRVDTDNEDNIEANGADNKLANDKIVVVKSKKERDKTIYTSEIKYVGKDTVVLPKCFESRLKLASFELKRLYSDLKNILLSYSGVHSRMLNTVEVFRKNGVWARIRIKAKSLYLYLNIKPEDINNVKFKAVEGVRGFESTPIEIKVSGNLKLRKSEELIVAMFDNAKIIKNPQYKSEDFTAHYPELDNAVMDNVNIKRLDGRD